MVEVRNLADELGLGHSALLKSVKKLGITPSKENRQTETGVQRVACLTDDQAARVRKHYTDARTAMVTDMIARDELTQAVRSAVLTALDDSVEESDVVRRALAQMKEALACCVS